MDKVAERGKICFGDYLVFSIQRIQEVDDLFGGGLTFDGEFPLMLHTDLGVGCVQSTDLTDKQVLPTLLNGQTLVVDLSTPGKVAIVGANSTANVMTPDVAANQVRPSRA